MILSCLAVELFSCRAVELQIFLAAELLICRAKLETQQVVELDQHYGFGLAVPSLLYYSPAQS